MTLALLLPVPTGYDTTLIVPFDALGVPTCREDP